jgi:nucleotide-binding universal stress UspA family protein
MMAFVTDWAVERGAGTGSSPTTGAVFAVVGFDGSEPAQRALDGAARLLRGRDGEMEVVYVASLPATASLSGGATVELEKSFDDRERELSNEVRTRLHGTESRWRFQRRDGAVAHELIAAADELRRLRGPDANVVIVVGGSSQRYHRMFGSAALNVVRHDRYPVVVVP